MPFFYNEAERRGYMKHVPAKSQGQKILRGHKKEKERERVPDQCIGGEQAERINLCGSDQNVLHGKWYFS